MKTGTAAEVAARTDARRPEQARGGDEAPSAARRG
jgi:hypothetical protein